MLVAISRVIKNKPDEGDFRKKKLNGTFENLDISLADLGAEVSQGNAFCAQHSKQWRKKENFLGAGFLAADIDHGLTIPDALGHPFVKEFGGLLYTSSSHTDEKHRFRIVFELEESITDMQTMQYAYTGLIRKFGADRSCRDACRMFFGNTQTQAQMLLGRKLTLDEVDALVLRGQEADFVHDSIIPGSIGPATVHSRLVIDAEMELRNTPTPTESTPRYSAR